MSGIAGIYYLDGRPAVDHAVLEQMVNRIAHRGPDGKAIWSQGPVGLGHRMLHTTPESLSEKLPLVSPSGEFAITADARIDNRDELISQLNLRDRPPQRIADSELILAAYERWGGESCVEKLLGDFAFAIWDAKRQELFCARDHMGVKPFYYYRGPGVFVFGSEIKALLCLPEVPRRLNEVRVADYLCGLLEDKEITFYEGIVRLPPAHTLTVGSEGSKPKQYWHLDPSREIRLGSDAEYAEAFRSIFTEAVRCRLRSAFPVGSMLSGGLDSSSIVCVARRLLRDRAGPKLHTFSATFDEVPECNERLFIETVLAQGDLHAHWVRADRLSPLTDADRILQAADEPFYSPNLYIHLGLFQAAAGAGVRVLMDGFEGDAVVSHGIKRLAELARACRWRELGRNVSKIAIDFQRPRSKVLWKHAIKPCLPPALRAGWLKLRDRVGPRWNPEGIVNREIAQKIRIEDRFRSFAPQTEPRTEKEAHLRRLESGVLPFSREVADQAAAAFGIQPVYPFADKRLVEFCLCLPPEQKLQEGWTRWILRQAMEGILPREVQWRGGKSDLSANFNRGLRQSDRRLLDEIILRNPGPLEKFVEIERLRAVYGQFLAEGGSQTAMAVWKPATLGLWLWSATGIAAANDLSAQPKNTKIEV